MAITIDLPPQMAQEVQDYVLSCGTTIEQLLFDHLKSEIAAHFSDERMDVELERGYSSYRTGKARPLSVAHAAFRRRHEKDIA